MMSKLFRMFFVLLLTVTIAGFTTDGEAALKKVAVMPFENVSGWDESRVADIITEQITVAIVNSGNYTLAERSQLGRAINEINFQGSGIVDPAQAIQFGKMAGTDYSIVGKVLLAEVIENNTASLAGRAAGGINLGPLGNLGGLGEKFIGRNKGMVTLNVRFIDNTTGQVLFAKEVKGAKAHDDRQVALYEACKVAAENVLKEIQKKNPMTGTIIDSDAGVVYIDKGSDAGVKEGETLIVFKEGAPITKPDGTIVAIKTHDLGKVKVTEVNADYSVCKVVDGGAAVVKNAKVRRGK